MTLIIDVEGIITSLLDCIFLLIVIPWGFIKYVRMQMESLRILRSHLIFLKLQDAKDPKTREYFFRRCMTLRRPDMYDS